MPLRYVLTRGGCLALIAILAALTSAHMSAGARSDGQRSSLAQERHFVRAAANDPVRSRCEAQRLLAAVGAAQRTAMKAPSRTIRLAKPVRQTPPLLEGGYVFPVLGPMTVVDTFGAPRADVAWHHGDDLFAPRGTPVLAVAKGIVFSVGWQRLGGRRLWLRDDSGNEFYYAHLNAYSAAAINGQYVRAGDVLGSVGNSGDAEQTPPHLHFEIHPASLLRLGYDGAVDPTRYLTTWRHIRRPRPTSGSGCDSRAYER